MIDIIVPCQVEAQTLLACLDSFEAVTEVRHQYVICNDGGGAAVTEAVRVWAGSDLKKKVTFLENKSRAYYSEAVVQCLAYRKNKYAAIVHPCLRMETKEWVAEMVPPIAIDPLSIASFVDIVSPRRFGPPVHTAQLIPQLQRGLFVIRDDVMIPRGNNIHDPVEDFCADAFKRRKRMWVVPNVRVRMDLEAIEEVRNMEGLIDRLNRKPKKPEVLMQR